MKKYHATRSVMIGSRQYATGDIVYAEVPDTFARNAGLVCIDQDYHPDPRKQPGHLVGMGDRPEISIVITFHDQEKFVRDCLRSWQEQTVKVPYEIIAVNDASEDNTADVIAKEFPNVRLFNVDFKRAASSRNYGKAQARGKFIGWFDGDDWVKPEYLEKLHDALIQHPEKDVAYSRFDFGDWGLAQGRLPICGSFEWSHTWVRYAAIINTPSLMRMELANKIEWDPGSWALDDWIFNRRMSDVGANPIHVRESLWNYRIHSGSLWGSGRGNEERKRVIKFMKHEWETRPKKPECTFVSMISRWDTLNEYFESVSKCKMPKAEMHWFIFIDTDDEKLVDRVKFLSESVKFHTRRIFVTGEKNLATASNFTERAMRISRNVKVCINECLRSDIGTPYMFMTEDDTVFPANAWQKLWKTVKERDVAIASGIETSRTVDRHMGYGFLFTNEDGEIVERHMPGGSSMQNVKLDVNSCGWYCWIGRVQDLADWKPRCIEDGRFLGPDSLMAFDLDKEGKRVRVDTSVQCRHWDPRSSKWVDVADAIAYEIKYEKCGKRWEAKTEKTHVDNLQKAHK